VEIDTALVARLASARCRNLGARSGLDAFEGVDHLCRQLEGDRVIALAARRVIDDVLAEHFI
jgi:hypothetical protein